MEPNSDTTQIVETIRKEHRSTRWVFGISIIILAVVLAVLSPALIRVQSQDDVVAPIDDALMEQEGMMTDESVPTPDESVDTTESDASATDADAAVEVSAEPVPEVQ